MEQQEVKPHDDDSQASVLTRQHPMLLKLKQPSWRVMLKRWNQQYSVGHTWRYGYVRNFQRDFNRAAKAIVSPPALIE